MPSLASHRHIRAERRRYQRAQLGKAWSVKDLPKYYYHKNFSEIINKVYADHSDLLGADGRDFIEDFRKLPFPAQCAFTRMSARKGFVFNIARFDYPEIDELTDQFHLLADRNFVRRVGLNDFLAFLSSLTKSDLVLLLSDHLCETKFKKSWRKEKLIHIGVDEILFEDVTIGEDVWVQARQETLDYIFFLHSGPAENNLQNLTLRDLGLVKAPKSQTSYGAQFECEFSAKAAWFYAAALRDFNSEDMRKITGLLETVTDWPAPKCVNSATNRDRLLHKLGKLRERQGEVESALKIYALSDTALCNERVIRLRYKKGEKDWVKGRLEGIIENSSSDQEHAFAEDFYARKFQKKRTSVVTDILRQAETIELDEAFRNQPERAVLRYFKENGLVCYRTENVPWRNLFGLLFWDEIYADTPTRSLPKPLKSGAFYELNKESIERKLEDLGTPHLVMINLLKTLTQHFGTRQPIVHWGSRSLDRINALIETAPPDSLAYMIRAMAKDWAGTKDGFPDLMIIEENVCRFIEVKAVGDVIRRNQLTRLRQLRSAGFSAKILQVDWTIDPDQTYVVVDVETTGGRPGLHRVTEIGAVKVKGGEIIDTWSSLINPQRSVPANITRLTGISQEMVATAPLFGEIADSFAAFMGDAIFAAHNVNFDYGFISAEFEMIDRRFRHPKICTCSSMRKLYPGFKSYALKNLCQAFSINLDSHHRALCDAKAAAELLILINEKRMSTDG